MSNFLHWTDEQKINVIRQLVNKIGTPAQVIEKDLWVTAILQIIFSLPFAENLVFKGGTSLSKVWNAIERFSEDIDLAIDRQHFGYSGDLSVKQLKKLRKKSSLFVKDDFCKALQNAVNQHEIQNLCSIAVQPDGEGDNTYPEPRKIFVYYRSLFDKIDYITHQ